MPYYLKKNRDTKIIAGKLGISKNGRGVCSIENCVIIPRGLPGPLTVAGQLEAFCIS